MVMYTGGKFGAIAGFIATWSISTAIAASELELGQQIGTFYSNIGIALGFNTAVNSAYLGFGLHIITGTIVGAILGAVATKWSKDHNMVDSISSDNCVVNSTFNKSYCCYTSGPNTPANIFR
jgi:hypothetical protein